MHVRREAHESPLTTLLATVSSLTFPQLYLTDEYYHSLSSGVSTFVSHKCLIILSRCWDLRDELAYQRKN